jgi:hypothetical protein
VLALAVRLTLWSERTLLGREAGVTMLVVLMALKTLELRARRDALVVFFLGFFLVLTHFLYSQSLLVALSMLVSVWGLLTALVLAHMPVGPAAAAARRRAGRARGAAGRTGDGAAVRCCSRAWAAVGRAAGRAGRTGLSGTLRMGGVAEIANDDSIALRVRFFGRVPRPTSCTSAARCCRASTAANGRAIGASRRAAAAQRAAASARRCVRADARAQPAAAAAAARDDARPRPTPRPRSKASR